MLHPRRWWLCVVMIALVPRKKQRQLWQPSLLLARMCVLHVPSVRLVWVMLHSVHSAMPWRLRSMRCASWRRRRTAKP